MVIPTFEFKGVSVATTYRFRVPTPLGGWAFCTVNDSTGELGIQSDFGNWSYRWSPDPKHLGAPTLTHFIADRNAYDYLAAKLLGRSGCYEFDAAETVREFRKQLVERRLDYARAISNARHGRRALSREVAREMWDLLGELEGAYDAREFVERFEEDDHLPYWISERPAEELQHRTSRDYRILTEGILPALVAACAAQLLTRGSASTLAAEAC